MHISIITFNYNNEYKNQNFDRKNLNFGSIRLKKKDLVLANELMSSIVSSEVPQRESLIIKLYRLFESYIENEGKLKAKASYVSEDIVSELKLKFFEAIDKIDNSTRIGDIIKKINSYKPNKNVRKTQWRQEVSLDKPTVTGRPLSDYTTAARLPVPQSANNKERIAKELDSAINTAPLSPKALKRLNELREGKSYVEIAADEQVSASRVHHSVQKSILIIQELNGVLPKEIKIRIRDIANILGITDIEKFTEVVLAQPQLLYQPLEVTNYKAEKAAELLGITKAKFVKASLEHPELLIQLPETINSNAEASAKLLGITKEKFVTIALKKPPLFCMLPETLNKKIQDLVEAFDVDRKKLIDKVLKYPQILGLSTKTLIQRVDDSAKILNSNRKEFIKAALRHPSLFYMLPKTINQNVENSAKLLGISRKKFIEIALKCPTLFIEKPETLNRNVNNAAELFEIDRKLFIEAALKLPQMFYQSPSTLNKNIEETAKVLNMSKKEYLQYAQKHPTAFCINSELVKARFKLLSYYKQIQGDTSDVKISLCISQSRKRILNNIFAYFMQTNNYSKYSRTETINKMPKILELYKDSKCIIVMPEHEAAEQVKNYMRVYSKNTVGEDIFEFRMAA